MLMVFGSLPPDRSGRSRQLSSTSAKADLHSVCYRPRLHSTTGCFCLVTAVTTNGTTRKALSDVPLRVTEVRNRHGFGRLRRLQRAARCWSYVAACAYVGGVCLRSLCLRWWRGLRRAYLGEPYVAPSYSHRPYVRSIDIYGTY